MIQTLHSHRLTALPQSSRLSNTFIPLLLAAVLGFLHPLPPTASGCILLLDGWSPMPVGERAVHADIVAVGHVTRTFKDARNTADDSNTYTAEIRLTRVIKGRSTISAVQYRQPATASTTPSSSQRSASNRTDERRSSNVLPTVTTLYRSNSNGTAGSIRGELSSQNGSAESRERWPAEGRIYNVSNFGDKNACYADVVEGDVYIFFLTIFDGRLSAKYDDLFGAVAERMRDNEEEIDEAIGWKPWSDWSVCSAICGGGIQRRRRACTKSDSECEGDDLQQRRCNWFRCKGSRDLLTLTGVTSLPAGVRRVPDRPSAYVIDHASSINAPLTKVVPRGTSSSSNWLPNEFSLLINARQKSTTENGGGYILTVNDILGFVHLGVKLGRGTYIELNRAHQPVSVTDIRSLADDTRQQQQQQLPSRGNGRATHQWRSTVSAGWDSVDLLDDSWHQVALGVARDHVTLYVDCEVTGRKRWRTVTTSVGAAGGGDAADSLDSTSGDNGVVSVGKAFVESSRFPRFEGEVEQLTLVVDDPLAATQQCEHRPEDYTHSDEHQLGVNELVQVDGLEKPDTAAVGLEASDVSSGRDGQSTPPTTPQPAAVFEMSWSLWSECSATCGHGLQARVRYCHLANNDVLMLQPGNQLVVRSADGDGACDRETLGRTETRPCTAVKQTTCPAQCSRPCHNGGSCGRDGRCQCRPGFYGRRCHIISCYPVCRNGGQCVEPNKCQCRPGYTGNACQTPICEPACMNGGRCVRPGRCSCPYGHLPPDCRPMCSTPCYNGGMCLAYNHCSCHPGYAGNLCQTAVCERGCENGGHCVAPNTCSCPLGYTGRNCQTPICTPPCMNGGRCIFPNFCLCSPGTHGAACENFICSPRCLNGGVCIGLNTCRCPGSHTGDVCHTENCPEGCHNGGTCVGRGLCRCAADYEGPTCATRKCRRETLQVPYQRPRNKLFTTQVTFKCGVFGWKTCTRTKYEYRIVFQTAYKTIERCSLQPT